MKFFAVCLVIVCCIVGAMFGNSCRSESPRSENELSTKIRNKIRKVSRKQDLADYEGNVLEAVGPKYEMIFVKGGNFVMGSPSDELDRSSDEGPQNQVSVGSFWMGKYEVTWDQYGAFWAAARANNDKKWKHETDGFELHDWISAPSQLSVTDYSDLSLGMGYSSEYPAVRMSQYGAKKFCQWLSAQTGHFYRLPTEAEWEYACRAGTTGPYSCNSAELAAYAVFDPDQTRVGYAKVGTKKPNPWGLYDMHGNVFEWVSDRYDSELYERRTKSGNTFSDPVTWPGERFPRVMRGGSWYDSAADLRSANREFSDSVMDPYLGIEGSEWWLPEAVWLGFRIVRPIEIPSAALMHEFWN